MNNREYINFIFFTSQKTKNILLIKIYQSVEIRGFFLFSFFFISQQLLVGQGLLVIETSR
jgi:hypothetical protein